MNLAEMVQVAREDFLHDTQEPVFWSNAQIARALNDALNDAVRRARLLVSERTITVRGGRAVLDDDLIYIKRAIVDGADVRLGRVSVRDLDDHCAGWEHEFGEPRFFVADSASRDFRLFPVPQQDVTVRLTVVREPVRLQNDADVPEIPARFHPALIYGACARLFARPDTETFDAERAAWHERLFIEEFGKRSAAIDETWILENYDAAAMQGVF